MELPFVSPAAILILTLASLYAIVFFLFFGQGWARLFLYWTAALAGFVAGNVIANAIGLGLFNIGTVHLVEGTLASGLALLAVRRWRG